MSRNKTASYYRIKTARHLLNIFELNREMATYNVNGLLKAASAGHSKEACLKYAALHAALLMEKRAWDLINPWAAPKPKLNLPKQAPLNKPYEEPGRGWLGGVANWIGGGHPSPGPENEYKEPTRGAKMDRANFTDRASRVEAMRRGGLDPDGNPLNPLNKPYEEPGRGWLGDFANWIGGGHPSPGPENEYKEPTRGAKMDQQRGTDPKSRELAAEQYRPGTNVGGGRPIGTDPDVPLPGTNPGGGRPANVPNPTSQLDSTIAGARGMFDAGRNAWNTGQQAIKLKNQVTGAWDQAKGLGQSALDQAKNWGQSALPKPTSQLDSTIAGARGMFDAGRNAWNTGQQAIKLKNQVTDAWGQAKGLGQSALDAGRKAIGGIRQPLSPAAAAATTAANTATTPVPADVIPPPPSAPIGGDAEYERHEVETQNPATPQKLPSPVRPAGLGIRGRGMDGGMNNDYQDRPSDTPPSQPTWVNEKPPSKPTDMSGTFSTSGPAMTKNPDFKYPTTDTSNPNLEANWMDSISPPKQKPPIIGSPSPYDQPMQEPGALTDADITDRDNDYMRSIEPQTPAPAPAPAPTPEPEPEPEPASAPEPEPEQYRRQGPLRGIRDKLGMNRRR